MSYLSRRELGLDAIVGRTSPDPALLKPSPHLVTLALGRIGGALDESVFVGDSPSDLIAGAGAGIPTIAFANRPGKRERFLHERACTAVIDSMSAIAVALDGAG